MAKRFTEASKWDSPSFRKMPPTQKLVWFYLMDKCNNAGFIEWDADACAFQTGMKLEHVEAAYKGLIRGLVGAKGTDWVYIPDFLKLQKNLPLNHENNAHRQIIALVEDMRPLFASIAKELLGPKKGLNSPTGKGKVKVKVEYSPEFDAWWAIYKKGNKSNAYTRWKQHDIKPVDIMSQTRQYINYCNSVDRPMLDGEGFINQRAFETEWTHSAQGTKPSGDELQRIKEEEAVLKSIGKL